jgi:adenylosuccinate synthase
VPATVVVGSQWGDEGKGRVVDLLSAEADLVVRYQGGNNAGHTVWVGETRFAFHLIPTGIIRGKRSLLGAGMVIDLPVLKQEEDELIAAGVEVLPHLRISENAHLILPYHKLLEKAEEERLGSHAIGTTRRGIGPAYEDKAARRGLRIGDLQNEADFAEKLGRVIEYKNLILSRVYGLPEVSAAEVMKGLRPLCEYYAGAICDTSPMVNAALAEGKQVLFEGAHGTLLDLDWGTYPFVTSSSPTAGAVASGIGLGPKHIGRVVGAAKAYTTRVGAGPFPTEMPEELAAPMREPGGEFGTTTGRARRIGWFDAVVVRKSHRLNALDSLAITHLDVLDRFEEVPLCAAYECDGTRTTEFPNDLGQLARCRPVYETLPGWLADTSQVRSFKELPANAQRYVRRIEELVGVPVSHVLVGRQRDQSIVV